MFARLMCIPFLLGCFAFATVAQHGAGDGSSTVSAIDHKDPLLRAMLTELKRSQQKLQLGEFQRPYYIEYQLFEVSDYVANARLGALVQDRSSLSRFVHVVVRIGDYKRDSFFREGTGAVEVMPIENNELALRRQLWLATDKAYKVALTGLTAKEQMLKNLVADSTMPDDFSREQPVDSVLELPRLEAQVDRWKQIVRSTSDLFRADAALDYSMAGLQFRIVNRYYVNTEGTVTRHGNEAYNVMFAGSGPAPDGTRLDRSHAYFVSKANELPTPEDVVLETRKRIASFELLRKAPIVEDDYQGPVLLSADAATAVFESLFVPNILGNRPTPGSSARVSGEYASYYKRRVLPDFFTVVDDPRPQKLDGLTLLGSYSVDDQGVKAEPITVVDQGILVNYLLGREPIRDFAHSNGRGRRGLQGSPGPQISNLIFKAANGVSFEELKRKLIQMCRDQGRPYGYYVETTGPGLAPRLLWRVYVSDGRMELVRGAVFDGIDTRTLRTDIIAAGNDRYIHNMPEPLPRSIVAPSLLFEDLEIKRAETSREKPPEYPAPQLGPQRRIDQAP
ncbi:MAG TPA: metallopeptidase TldD-related protein [Pyrinomonadaceae bacterium]|nr:metallopeptidase TldD-related protein [Pyrinomonadaceae bacterium]